MKYLVLVLLVTGCATYQPLIDTKGVDRHAYNRDMMECKQYAETVDVASEAATGAVGGAAIGAALGAIIGAFAGDPGYGASFGAAYGGSAGMAGGVGEAANAKVSIVQRCMTGRGYTVLR